MLYIVVPTFNNAEVLHSFVKMMKNQTCQDFEMITVDHGTTKVPKRGLENITFIDASSELWWSGAVNTGIRYVLNKNKSINDVILVLNDDMKFDMDFIEKVLHETKKYAGAVIGTTAIEMGTNQILHLNMKINKLMANFKYINIGKDSRLIEDILYDSDVVKGQVAIPVSVFRKIGLYNEEKLPHYMADHEFAWRAKKNGIIVGVSGLLRIERKLDSPNRMDSQLSFIGNYKRLFFHIRSTKRFIDIWNFAFCCFSKTYAVYYIIINILRLNLVFLVYYFRAKRNKKRI